MDTNSESCRCVHSFSRLRSGIWRGPPRPEASTHKQLSKIQNFQTIKKCSKHDFRHKVEWCFQMFDLSNARVCCWFIYFGHPPGLQDKCRMLLSSWSWYPHPYSAVSWFLIYLLFIYFSGLNWAGHMSELSIKVHQRTDHWGDVSVLIYMQHVHLYEGRICFTSLLRAYFIWKCNCDLLTITSPGCIWDTTCILCWTCSTIGTRSNNRVCGISQSGNIANSMMTQIDNPSCCFEPKGLGAKISSSCAARPSDFQPRVAAYLLPQ